MHVESTEKFYVHRVSNVGLLNEIISQIQDIVEHVNNLKVWTPSVESRWMMEIWSTVEG